MPEVVARHLVQAVRLAGEVRAPTGDDRELAAGAVAACQRAARRLRDQEALAATAQMLDDALALADLAGTDAEEQAELRLERGTVRGPPATCRAPWPTSGRRPARAARRSGRRPGPSCPTCTGCTGSSPSRRPPPTGRSPRRPRPATRR